MAIFCYLSITVFMINRFIKKITSISDERMLSFSTSSILFGLTMIPFNTAEFKFIENTIYRYMIIILIFGLGIFIMILANLKLKLKEKIKK